MNIKLLFKITNKLKQKPSQFTFFNASLIFLDAAGRSASAISFNERKVKLDLNKA
jgi:hypothetical protein